MTAWEMLTQIIHRGLIRFSLDDLSFLSLKPVEKMWNVGELSAKDDISIEKNLKKYVVSEEAIQRHTETPDDIWNYG